MQHHVIFVPGLDDNKRNYKFFINPWKKFGITPHVYRIGWKNGENKFEPKLKLFNKYINNFLNYGDKVSLVGNSAGASAVLNAYLDNPKINAVVNSCGRLRAGDNVRPNLDWAARKSPAFKESVLLFEKREPKMTTEQRKKVLVMQPIGDEIVPKSTMLLIGAKTQRILGVEHTLNSLLAVTIYSPKIMDFIQKK